MNFLIDTHTHFDIPEYHNKQYDYAKNALLAGVKHIVLIGLLAKRFDEMIKVCQKVNAYDFDDLPLEFANKKLTAHLAMGLHPLYINQHQDDDLAILDEYLKKYPNIAISEIGLDTYLDELRLPEVYKRQQYFFAEQVTLAKQHHLPILLHIRKAHADSLKLIKQSGYNAIHQGGIAHAFSGGEQEGLAFVKLGFKLGVTGQITNPNAKKLHRTIQSVVNYAGLNCLVIETDCPDMMPLPCQHKGRMNEPANLPHILDALTQLLAVDKDKLVRQLWENSCQALKYPFD